MHQAIPEIMTTLDALGSFVFALSGGLLAVQKKFDLFGVLVLSFVVAVTGGITRDLMIGAVPPVAIALRTSRKEARSFLKKRTKKLLFIRSFLLLFFKKEGLF